MENQIPDLDVYTINMRVEGYAGLCLDISVPAKDPDEAFDLACNQEFRYQDDDPYVLMVTTDDGGNSALCTYPTLAEATLHCGTITNGTWILVQRDGAAGGTILKTSEDEI